MTTTRKPRKTSKKAEAIQTRKPKVTAPQPIVDLPPNPFTFEVLALASKQRSSAKKVEVLKKYVTENGKILSSKISSVSQGKQRLLTNEIKKAKILGLIWLCKLYY